MHRWMLCNAGLAATPGTAGLHVAHKWLADLLVYLSRDATAYSAVKVVGLLIPVTTHCLDSDQTSIALQHEQVATGECCCFNNLLFALCDDNSISAFAFTKRLL